MRSSEWVTTVVDRTASAPASDAEKVAGVEALFSRHYEPLVRSLSFVALDRDLAADAAQEAFFQLYLKWDRISQYDDPIGWVYRVAINRCKDHRRALARAARLVQWVAGPVDRDGPSWTPEIEFKDALRRLPSRQRTAAALHYVAGLSVEQVAAAMGISEGAVKSHLFRARESLRAQLGAGS